MIIKDGKYPSLNGLRAISILLVIVHHLQIQYGMFSMPPNPIVRVLIDGQMGVNVFFVISGFLITHLLLKEEQNTHTIDVKSFFVRRILRIFPAYFFLLLVYYCLTLFHVIAISNLSWLTSVTFTKYFVPMDDWYTHHAWSLSIEEHFYLMWPFIFLCGDRVRKITTCFFIVLPVCVRVFTYYHPVMWMDELTLFKRIDAIAIGCIIAMYQHKILEITRSKLSILFYVSVTALVLLPYVNGVLKRVDLEILIIPFGVTTGLLANILIAVILVYSVFGSSSTLWFKWLNSEWMNAIGLLSYSLYLWQQFFLCNRPYWINQFPQNIVGMIAAACFSYFVIEKPFLKLKKRFSPMR